MKMISELFIPVTDCSKIKPMIDSGHQSNTLQATRSGFTIVELLIVIVVIAILAAITIVAYNGIQEQSRTARAQSDLRNLTQAIQAARINTNRTLVQITGQTDARSSKSNADAAIDSISAASGMNIAGIKNGDPWGNYYRIDPNEKELSASDCRADSIQVLNRTNLTVSIPLSQPPCI